MNFRLLVTIIAIFIFSIHSYSQIKVSSDSIYEYIFGESQCRDFAEDYISTDSVFVGVKEIIFPIVETNNQKLNVFINDTIQNFIGINQVKRKFQKLNWNYSCILDKPSEFYAKYKIIFSNQEYFCLTIYINEYACCGANGSSHNLTPFTFDLKQKKILRLKDIIKENYFELINKIIREKIDDSYFESFYTIDYTTCFVEIYPDKVRIYYENSTSRGQNRNIDFEFEKYPDLFKKSFLTRIIKK